MASLPILDLGLFLSESAEDQAQFVRNLQDAVLKYGFFYLKNAPSLTPELQDRALAQARAFFSLPIEQKLQIEMINSPHFRGYQRMGAETTNFKQDNREQIDYGPEVTAETMTETSPAYLGLKGPNQWPDLPGFRDTIETYINACVDIAKALMKAVAVSLELDENHFSMFEHEPHTRMKVIRYPPMGHETDRPHEHGLGVGPHKVCLTSNCRFGKSTITNWRTKGLWLPNYPITRRSRWSSSAGFGWNLDRELPSILICMYTLFGSNSQYVFRMQHLYLDALSSTLARCLSE